MDFKILIIDTPSNVDFQMCPQRTNLPSPREISHTFHTDNDIPSTQFTHMVTQFGQILDHDIADTPSHEDENCCSNEHKDECFPIPVPSTDSFYSHRNVDCLEFTRSVAYCEENGGVWQQFNGLTHFVDASIVYGSDEETANNLRSFVDGKLKMGMHNLLPKDDDNEEMAGDHRVREMPGLTSLHTLFKREHNRICERLQEVFIEFNTDEYLYQLARRILIAEIQSVVYGEFLPAILGSQNLEGLVLLSEGSAYDSKTNPSITNEFSTASYRFGHSMIQGIIQLFTTTNPRKDEQFVLHDEFRNSSRLSNFEGKGIEKILMGLINQPSQTFDKEVSIEVTNFLFPDETGKSFGGDLVARNIQRGRDHGLPGFCCYYKLYEDENFNCNNGWSQRYNGFSPDNWALLQSIYEKPNDIDLFTGGLAQESQTDGLTGNVFTKMIGISFYFLKFFKKFILKIM